jgi:chemotaxis response regulator CheB
MQIIAIGASAGGPHALAEILSLLPGDLPAFLLIVQHVNKEFSAGLARWLNLQTALRVRIAPDGGRPEKGTVFVAGTDEHLILRPDFTFSYIPGPRDNPFRPSIDVFFHSMARYYCGRPERKKSMGILLTGMGKDGAEGLLALRRAGCHTLAQDEHSSAVYGMPKAARKLGAAAEILPLGKIAPAILSRIYGKS